MRSVQDHVATIPEQAFAIRSLDAVDQANEDEVMLIQEIAEFVQAWRGMINRNLMD